MGLQCSILGHSFEPDGVERERETQGSEVVTTEREIERCARCGTERVVSESTEVTAVVDADAVDLDDDAAAEAASEPAADGTATDGTAPEDEPAGEAADADGAADVSAPEAPSTEDDGLDPDGELPDDGGAEIIDETVESADETEETARDVVVDAPAEDAPAPGPDPDPDGEDAVILSDESDDAEEPLERAPGQWPDDAEAETDADGSETLSATPDDNVEPVDEQSLSGITVPDGYIVCPDCDFSVEAHSGYREGDPCPDCSAWLESERNR